jgi:hypothetical protein
MEVPRITYLIKPYFYGIQCCSYSVVTIHGAYNASSSVNLLYFYISIFRSVCAVPNMAVFCSSLV